MISISELLDMEDVEPALWEEARAELKKRIDASAQSFVNGYFEEMIQAGCSIDVMKHSSRVALNLLEEYVIIDNLEDDYNTLYYEIKDEDLEDYLSSAVWQARDLAISQLADKEIIIKDVKGTDSPIDYSALKDILSCQCKELFEDRRYSPKPTDIPLVYDLNRRTLRLFKFIQDEICSDDEFMTCFENGEVDKIVERLIFFISKYDGINIPAPYDDIDDWWGDYNHTINYFVNCYTEYGWD